MQKRITIGFPLILFLLFNQSALLAQAANDNVCNALLVQLDSAAISVSNIDASVESGEELLLPPRPMDNGHNGLCGYNGWCDRFIRHSLWFKFKAPSTGALNIDLCGSDFNSQVALYEVVDCADFSSFRLLQSSDDREGCGSGNGLSPTIRMECLTPDEEYYILVDDRQSSVDSPLDSGQVVLQLTTEEKIDPGVGTCGPHIKYVTCIGGSDGAIDTYLITGMPPISYQWGHGATEPDLFDIPAGEYTLTVTDFCGSSFHTSINVREPEEVTPVTFAKDNLDIVQLKHCGTDAHGGQLSPTLSSGIPPFQYHWSNGANEAHIDSLDIGFYTLTVTDFCNSTAAQTFQIGADAGPNQECDNSATVKIGKDLPHFGGKAHALTYNDIDPSQLNSLFSCEAPGGIVYNTTYWQAYDLQNDFGLTEDIWVNGMEVFLFARNPQGYRLHGGVNMEFRLYKNNSTDLSDTSNLQLIDEVITKIPPMSFSSPSYIVPFEAHAFKATDIVVIEAAYVKKDWDKVEIYHLGIPGDNPKQPTYLSAPECLGVSHPIAMNTGILEGLDQHFANKLLYTDAGPKLAYNWDNSSGGLSADDIARPLASAGTYAVTITDIQCDQSSTDEVTVANNCLTFNTATSEPALSHFTLSPNPSNGWLELQQNEWAAEKLSIQVFDLRGKLVYAEPSQRSANKSQSIDIAHLAKGIYILQVLAGEEVENHKIILQ